MNVRQLIRFIAIKLMRTLQKYNFRKRYYPEKIWSWCGIEFIKTTTICTRKKNKLIKKYTIAKGDISQVHLIDEFTLSYDDHVTRIRSQKKLGTALFHKPKLSDDNYILYIIKRTIISNFVKKLFADNKNLLNTSKKFEYKNMEIGLNNRPICVGIPESLSKNFVLNENNEIQQNVLHLPIKISKNKALELYNENRVLLDKTRIDFNKIYLPKELDSLMPLIKHVCDIEMAFNSNFLQDYYIFLSVSHSVVKKNTTQRRGGWHIDGHQGLERMGLFGKKMLCDRQYLISNTLPTQAIAMQFNFDSVYQYCRKNGVLIDDVNMQDVIEFYASKKEHSEINAVISFEPNKLYFLNPYMVHRATHNTENDINRTFVRILCSTYARDRLGDTINPIIGPIYPLKIKTITDIHEIDLSYLEKSLVV